MGSTWYEAPMALGGFYERHVLPALTDKVCGARTIDRQRAKVVPRARGRVLEVGVGTGLNLKHYDRAAVERLVALDPGLHPLARSRAEALGLPLEPLALSAERIPADDGSFDTVVVTYTLCTIPDPVRALREMRRVLAPGGQLLFSEHGLAPDAAVARTQRLLDGPWSVFAGGCHLDRDAETMLHSAGFRCGELDRLYLPGPRFFNYHSWGRATPA